MKYTIKLKDIVGPHKLPGFNGVGEINLEDYVDHTVDIPKGFDFGSLGSIDLNEEVEAEADEWSNDGVREVGNTEERIDSLQNSFSVNGYKTPKQGGGSPGMGFKDDDGKQKPVEGRGRALGGKRNLEKKMPWINLRKTDPGDRPRITGGVLANLSHDPATKATLEDVITAGLSLINGGELEPNEVDINEWLKNDLDIFKFFVQGKVTQIVDGIIKRYSEGENVVRIKERKEWVNILNSVFKIPVDNKTIFLFSMDSDTYSSRCFTDAVLEYGTKKPVQIILYTKRKLPSEARKKKQIFMNDMERYTRKMYSIVGANIKTKFQEVEPSEHYEIIGCIPQFIIDHAEEWDSKTLIGLNDY